MDFTLKSGAKLHVSTAPFEAAVGLVETIKRVSFGIDPSVSVDDLVLAHPDVRKALYPCFESAVYETMRVTPELFDDPKLGKRARGDYFEICSRVIEVNTKDFFLKTSTTSTEPSSPPTESPK